MANLGFGFNMKVVALRLSFPTHGHGPHSNSRRSSQKRLETLTQTSRTARLKKRPLFTKQKKLVHQRSYCDHPYKLQQIVAVVTKGEVAECVKGAVGAMGKEEF
ncbi:hypothetical protein QL285_046121 [Trifolium repens]|nr:hypothetical protein QL285_046121 [Trifolium repens]